MDLIFDFFSSKLWKRLLVFYLPSDSQKIATEILKWFQCLNHVLKAFSFFFLCVCVWWGAGCCREFLYNSLLRQNSKPVMIVERELNCILMSKLFEGKKSRFRIKLSAVSAWQRRALIWPWMGLTFCLPLRRVNAYQFVLKFQELPALGIPYVFGYWLLRGNSNWNQGYFQNLNLKKKKKKI